MDTTTARELRRHGAPPPETITEEITIRCRDLDHFKFFTFDHPLETIDRIDDCRCVVTVKAEIAVGEGLRKLATLFDLAAEFYEAEARMPHRPTEIHFEM